MNILEFIGMFSSIFFVIGVATFVGLALLDLYQLKERVTKLEQKCQ